MDERQHGYMALAGDYGCTGVRGFAGYPEICEFLQRNGTQYVFDNETQVPYAFNEREWISFDNEQSAIRKVRSFLGNEPANAVRNLFDFINSFCRLNG